MAHPKRRVFQHIMEDKSLSLLKTLLPDEWVVREYKPDYGIDIVIELFQYIDETEQKADALGEFVFAQIKSVKKTSIKKLSVYPRANVEKFLHSPQQEDSLEIDVIRFQLETDELLTIQAMGAGIPVLLFLVCLDLNKVFFICLNDLLDKVIIPENPNYCSQQSKVIYIPVKNELTKSHDTKIPIRFYAKRSKLYAAFCKFAYQENEVAYLCENIKQIPLANLSESSELKTLLHFLTIILRYDFWETTEMWQAIQYSSQEIKVIQSLLNKLITTKNVGIEDFSEIQFSGEAMVFEQEELLRFILCSQIQSIWHRLKNLSNIYEEICREWYLPTFLSQNLSYPHT